MFRLKKKEIYSLYVGMKEMPEFENFAKTKKLIEEETHKEYILLNDAVVIWLARENTIVFRTKNPRDMHYFCMGILTEKSNQNCDW
jgi:hypothetical protein